MHKLFRKRKSELVLYMMLPENVDTREVPGIFEWQNLRRWGIIISYTFGE